MLASVRVRKSNETMPSPEARRSRCVHQPTMPPMDLAELVATMPFAVAVGIEIDAASKDGVTGHLAVVRGAVHDRGPHARRRGDDPRRHARRGVRVPQPPGRCGDIDDHVVDELLPRRARRRACAAPPTRCHVGRTTIVVQTELRDVNDKLVALVTQTQAVLTP